MANKSTKTRGFDIPHSLIDNPTLVEEYTSEQSLYSRQPIMVQRFLDSQSQKMIDAIRKNQMQAVFTFPDKVTPEGQDHPVQLPSALRDQEIGSVMNRLIRTDLRSILRQRLIELVESPEPSVSTAARLFRHSMAMTMVHTVLPAGRNVEYRTANGEEIPSEPVGTLQEPESAITQASDAIAEVGAEKEKRGDFQVPFVPAARKFYLPQWVVVDETGHLLVNSIAEAEAHITSMKQFLAVLHNAVALAPYIMVDPIYQQKRYGMLGQLVNQGRALALYETHDMVRIIKSRASANDLNRGLNLSLPYFDDQLLEVRTHNFEVIPAGRIMFVPAFVVRASREEQAKVAQDTRLSPSTRKYLLAELLVLEQAFINLSKHS
jgi:hypothetical protein